MRFTLRIDMDNAAFEDDPTELQRIIGQVSVLVTHDPCHAQSVFDYNGNRVGQWKVEDEAYS